MIEHLVVRVIAKLLIPLIMLFALYVQFHGEYGPGGGFQAGVIFASAFILYALVFGVDKVMEVVSWRLLQCLAALGVLIYGGVGVVGLLQGANYLAYDVLAHDPVHGQELGIFLVEIGVGLTVASVMILIFCSFAGRR